MKEILKDIKAGLCVALVFIFLIVAGYFMLEGIAEFINLFLRLAGVTRL